jgi:protein YibB
MNHKTTIVTAFFDIGRGNWTGVKNGQVMPFYLKRTTENYFENFSRIAAIQNPMVIYTEPKYHQQIIDIREKFGLEGLTTIVEMDVFENWKPLLDKISSVQKNPEYLKGVTQPSMPEYWNAEYVLINYLKSYFICDAIENDLIETEQTAWIDFGYARTDDTVPKNLKWEHDFGDKINFFNIKEIQNRPIVDIIKTNDVYIQGCHIVAPTNKWHHLWNLMQLSMEELLRDSLIDDDQTLLLMSYLKDKENFKLNYVDVNNWFIIFKDYQ